MLIALGGALPIVLFGIYSKAHGAHFLPTPVLFKGRHFDLKDVTAYFDLLGGDLLDRFGTEAYALSLAVAAAGLAFYLIRRDGFWTPNVLALLLTLGTVILHLELASVGWFFRYESYFLAMGVTFLGATLARLLAAAAGALAGRAHREGPRHRRHRSGVLILSAPLWRRAITANNNTPHGVSQHLRAADADCTLLGDAVPEQASRRQRHRRGGVARQRQASSTSSVSRRCRSPRPST